MQAFLSACSSTSESRPDKTDLETRLNAAGSNAIQTLIPQVIAECVASFEGKPTDAGFLARYRLEEKRALIDTGPYYKYTDQEAGLARYERAMYYHPGSPESRYCRFSRWLSEFEQPHYEAAIASGLSSAGFADSGERTGAFGRGIIFKRGEMRISVSIRHILDNGKAASELQVTRH